MPAPPPGGGRLSGLRPAVHLLLIFAVGATLTAAERLKQAPDMTAPNYLRDNRNPGVTAWVRPQYPPERNATWRSEHVTVAVIIDEMGNPVDPEVRDGPVRFQAAALEAIRQWRFTPAMVAGKPARIEMLVRFEFIPDGTPKGKKPDWPPYLLSWPELTPAGDPPALDPTYPEHLSPRRLSGIVGLAVSLDTNGRADGVKIAHATHPEFLAAALREVAEWRCQPAHRGRIPQPGIKIIEMKYIPLDETGRPARRDWLERNGIRLRDRPDTKASDFFDTMVTAVQMTDPVYPRELAQNGTAGTAQVDFSVDLDGRVVSVRVVEASADEFGRSLAAAIEAWRFEPLLREGTPCHADFSMSWRFEPPAAGSVERRLVDSIGQGSPPVDARELDRPLLTLHVRQPTYPAALRDAGEAGEARIEVIVDREGRVRLPHIRSASHPALGWAAATAVSQWFFETPLKDGKPVEVRVVVPVTFKVPPAK